MEKLRSQHPIEMDQSSKQTVTFKVSLESTEQEVTAAYLVMGDGPVVLLLHGFLCEASYWSRVTQHLQGHYRCICLDLLGFGDSSRPEIDYTVESQVVFVQQFLHTLAVDCCYLMGHSLGGWVAASYALQTNSLLGLILVAPAGMAEDLLRFQVLRPLSWQTPVIDSLLAVLSPFAFLCQQSDFMKMLNFYRQQLRFEPVMQAWCRRIFKLETSTELLSQDIERLRWPTLIIAGEADQIIPLWHCQAYARKIPGAQLEVIDGADHFLPRRHGELISAFCHHFMQNK